MTQHVAIAYDKGQIFSDFDKCKEFIIYSFAEKITCSATVMGIIENGFSDINNIRLRFLLQNNVRSVICDKISDESKNTIKKVGIHVIDGVTGSAEQAFEAFKHGKLQSE